MHAIIRDKVQGVKILLFGQIIKHIICMHLNSKILLL